MTVVPRAGTRFRGRLEVIFPPRGANSQDFCGDFWMDRLAASDVFFFFARKSWVNGKENIKALDDQIQSDLMTRQGVIPMAFVSRVE